MVHTSSRASFFTTAAYACSALISLGLLIASWQHLVPIGITEVFGFITGGLTVWLTVKENIWNWPIGIANNVFFIILFFQSHLFADMALQVVYIVLSVLGWYWWLRGGKNQSALTVSHVDMKTLLVLIGVGIIATAGMTRYLSTIQDSAPFWDALTTVMSLIAQYLLTKKYIENWYVWLSADVIYVALYAYKSLYLTSVLYAIFFAMCIAGLYEWKRSLERTEEDGARSITPEYV